MVVINTRGAIDVKDYFLSKYCSNNVFKNSKKKKIKTVFENVSTIHFVK